MAKSNAERRRAFRERQRAKRPPKKPPKSNRQRCREYRARKKQKVAGVMASIKTETPDDVGNQSQIKIEEITLQPYMDSACTLRTDETYVKHEIKSCDELHEDLAELPFTPKFKHENDPLAIPQTDNYSTLFHRCTICNEVFDSAELLQTHFYMCKEFNEENATTQLVSPHALKPTKSHGCNVCEKAFEKVKSLRAHLKTHSLRKQFKCDLCPKEFSHACTLRNHKVLHTDGLRYECDICAKRFFRKDHLTAHKRVHSGERPYECDVCEKRFSQKTTLVIHMRVHTGERPYQCVICSKRFTERKKLVRHEHVHGNGTDSKKCGVTKV